MIDRVLRSIRYIEQKEGKKKKSEVKSLEDDLTGQLSRLKSGLNSSGQIGNRNNCLFAIPGFSVSKCHQTPLPHKKTQKTRKFSIPGIVALLLVVAKQGFPK